MIDLLIARFGAGVFKYAAVVFAVVASFVAFSVHEQHKGAVKAVAKIEKATDNAIKKGSAAADRSRSGGVRGGQVDPTTRLD